MVIVFPMQRSI